TQDLDPNGDLLSLLQMSPLAVERPYIVPRRLVLLGLPGLRRGFDASDLACAPTVTAVEDPVLVHDNRRAQAMRANVLREIRELALGHHGEEVGGGMRL